MPLPVDHHLGSFYRISAGVSGLCVLAWGIVGFTHTWSHPWFNYGAPMFGLTTNNPLNLISVVFGAILLIGAVIGGRASSLVNIVIGFGFMIDGLVWMCLIRTPQANILEFTMTNVVFSLVVGTILVTCGLYGKETHSKSRLDMANGSEPVLGSSGPKPRASH